MTAETEGNSLKGILFEYMTSTVNWECLSFGSSGYLTPRFCLDDRKTKIPSQNSYFPSKKPNDPNLIHVHITQKTPSQLQQQLHKTQEQKKNKNNITAATTTTIVVATTTMTLWSRPQHIKHMKNDNNNITSPLTK